jgi:Ca-activated chloride channel family protein
MPILQKPARLAWAALLLLLPLASVASSEETPYAAMRVAGGDGGPRLELPLKQTRVRAEVTDANAVTDICQVYKNDTGKKIEAVYQYPLPHDGAVTDMVVEVNGRAIFGSIKEREQARKEYEQARKEGKTASMVEQERPNLFTQNIANIQPGDDIRVTLRVNHSLRYSAGAFEYVFPITVGPRYMGGAPTSKSGEGWSPDTTQVPDASRVSPPYVPEGVGTSHLLDLELKLKTSLKLAEVKSTSHMVKVSPLPGGGRMVTLDRADRIPNKDFILRYSTGATKPQFSMQTHRPQGEDGFFSLTMAPPAVRGKGKSIPKEMVFVLDRSGSMSGVTIEKAKEALVKSVRRLNVGDSFNIIAFDDSVMRLWDAPKSASDARVQEGIRWASALKAGGGTEMVAPLTEALGYPKDATRQRIVLFITDGNVGYENRLVQIVRSSLGSARVFGVGIGSSVNRYLVSEVAKEGRGTAEFIRQDEDVAMRLNAVYARISNPVLTDVKLDFGGVTVSEVYPETLRDLFFEEPTVLVGRYQSVGDVTLTLHANSPEGPVTFTQPVSFPMSEKSNPSLRYAWARQKIAALSMKALGGETEELKREITAVSLRHSVLCKYTAFLAVEREARGDTRPAAERWIIPSELPESLRFQGFGPEISLKVDRVRPGDPVVFIKAAKNSRSVVARMPYGETLQLVWDDAIGKFSARFLVPFGTADGRYPFRVLITAADGTSRELKAAYVVDSRGPQLSVTARMEDKRLVLEAVPEADVFVEGEAEVWPDVKEVVAILPDGREVKLKLDRTRLGRFIWCWTGEPGTNLSGGVSIKVKAVDYAGNWREQRVVAQP